MKIELIKNIDAPIDMVFRAISDFKIAPDINPNIHNVEVISEHQHGKGLQILETRSVTVSLFCKTHSVKWINLGTG